MLVLFRRAVLQHILLTSCKYSLRSLLLFHCTFQQSNYWRSEEIEKGKGIFGVGKLVFETCRNELKDIKMNLPN